MPKAVRDHLRLAAGDRLDFRIEPEGQVVVAAAAVRLRDLTGFLPKPARPLSLEEIDEGIREAATERVMRGLQGRRRHDREGG